jgi:curved DNA-binding protein CbpA
VAPESNYYELLGVSSGADQDQIRKAFRERVRGCHPDRVANLDEDLRKLAEEKMVGLNEAYSVLRNPARRAAYDHRFAGNSTTSVASAPSAATERVPSAPATPRPRSGHQPTIDPGHARHQIGEQEFVARAAAEEFQHTVKRCVTGRGAWTPVDFRGATLAMRVIQGRNNLYFVLYAAPQLDDKQLRRFLKSLDMFDAKLKSRLWGRDRLFGFAAGVKFIDQQRLRSMLAAFNQRRTAGVREATLIDLVHWHVVPGEIGLQERLDNLLRGR